MFSIFLFILKLSFFRGNIDAKVYVRNIPTKKVTDEELLDFFKQFGKVSGLKFVFDLFQEYFIPKF